MMVTHIRDNYRTKQQRKWKRCKQNLQLKIYEQMYIQIPLSKYMDDTWIEDLLKIYLAFALIECIVDWLICLFIYFYFFHFYYYYSTWFRKPI